MVSLPAARVQRARAKSPRGPEAWPVQNLYVIGDAPWRGEARENYACVFGGCAHSITGEKCAQVNLLTANVAARTRKLKWPPSKVDTGAKSVDKNFCMGVKDLRGLNTCCAHASGVLFP